MCSTSLAFMKLKIKNFLRFYISPERMDNIKVNIKPEEREKERERERERERKRERERENKSKITTNIGKDAGKKKLSFAKGKNVSRCRTVK